MFNIPDIGEVDSRCLSLWLSITPEQQAAWKDSLRKVHERKKRKRRSGKIKLTKDQRKRGMGIKAVG